MLRTESASPELAEFMDAKNRKYYDKEADQAASSQYYANVDKNLSPALLFRALNRHLTKTHTALLPYAPSKHVYPWVDLQPDNQLRSIYSNEKINPEEAIRSDLEMVRKRAEYWESMGDSESVLDEARHLVAEDFLEASFPFNCEHVVPQSWFKKKEPMRGDLHHLFACEPACNSFRGNIPFFDFADFEEVVRQRCGKREDGGFEPAANKGVVARAVLYFLLRYPGQINSNRKEYTEEGIATLLAWHKANPVSKYERHRNQAIQQKQGNRNPVIDFPELVERIDFSLGLGDSNELVTPRRQREIASVRQSVAHLKYLAEYVPDFFGSDSQQRVTAMVGADASLLPSDLQSTEAIILQTRPVFFIDRGNIDRTTPGPQREVPTWLSKLDAVRATVQRNCASVGRIEVTGHPDDPGENEFFLGTGWVVAPNLIMTNRHVAKEFCDDDGRLQPGMTARIDFAEERTFDPDTSFSILRAVHIGLDFDYAILEVASDAGFPQPLRFVRSSSEVAAGTDCYTIGYPAWDGVRNDAAVMSRLFGDAYDVKRLAPGILRSIQLEPIHVGRRQMALNLETDYTTLGGNSGSPVFDLETGLVIGLHYSGRYKQKNFAVPVWRLAAAIANAERLVREGVARPLHHMNGKAPIGRTSTITVVLDGELSYRDLQHLANRIRCVVRGEAIPATGLEFKSCDGVSIKDMICIGKSS